jgi:hypothetical protein
VLDSARSHHLSSPADSRIASGFALTLSFVSRVATALHLSIEKFFLVTAGAPSTPGGIWTGHPSRAGPLQGPAEIQIIKKPKGISKVKCQSLGPGLGWTAIQKGTQQRFPKPKVGGSTPLGTAIQVKLNSETKDLSSHQSNWSHCRSQFQQPDKRASVMSACPMMESGP